MYKKLSLRHNNDEVIFMDNSDVQAYLDSLPVSVRTAIVESGAKYDTVEQLKVLAQVYMGQEKQ